MYDYMIPSINGTVCEKEDVPWCVPFEKEDPTVEKRGPNCPNGGWVERCNLCLKEKFVFFQKIDNFQENRFSRVFKIFS